MPGGKQKNEAGLRGQSMVEEEGIRVVTMPFPLSGIAAET